MLPVSKFPSALLAAALVSASAAGGGGGFVLPFSDGSGFAGDQYQFPLPGGGWAFDEGFVFPDPGGSGAWFGSGLDRAPGGSFTQPYGLPPRQRPAPAPRGRLAPNWGGDPSDGFGGLWGQP